MKDRLWRGVAATSGLFLIATACALTTGRTTPGGPGGGAASGEAPSPKETPGRRPSERIQERKMHAAPALASEGDVPGFVSWAAGSLPEEREDGRRAIATVAASPGASAVARGLVAEFERARQTDHSRALVALAVLGELRNKDLGVPFLTEFIARPLPVRGTLVDGEIIEQTAQLQLQGKAVHGLAYLRDEAADREVLRIVASHPSRVVRAEAISAWLWNRQDSQAARDQLARFVKPEDRVLIDRPRRTETTTADEFNRALAAWLKAHPELAAPAPVKAKPHEPKNTQGGPAFDAAPPNP